MAKSTSEALQTSVRVLGTEVPVRADTAVGDRSEVVVVLGHGAGSHMLHRTPQTLCAALRGAGADVVRFNFAYRVHGRAMPDRMPQLKACYGAVVDWVRQRMPSRRLVVGGHSMGGRVGSMLVADGLHCAGALLLAYPLHPAGRPEQLRDRHLQRIQRPVLCVSGTRDRLCRQELMEGVVARLPASWTQHWIAGADHSFDVLKRSGRMPEEVMQEVEELTRSWFERLSRCSVPAGGDRTSRG